MKNLLFLLPIWLLAIPVPVLACWETAARLDNTSPELLYAVAQAESTLNPSAINSSHLARTGTVDIGLMQINSNKKMLKNLGVTEKSLLNPCTNIKAGSKILAEKFSRYGRTWEAVGAYNASCVKLNHEQCQAARKRYAWRVYGFLHPAPKDRKGPVNARKRNMPAVVSPVVIVSLS